MPLPAPDFESGASTSSATSAKRILYRKTALIGNFFAAGDVAAEFRYNCFNGIFAVRNFRPRGGKIFRPRGGKRRAPPPRFRFPPPSAAAQFAGARRNMRRRRPHFGGGGRFMPEIARPRKRAEYF